MKELIDKSAVIAEIEKELNTTKKYSTEYVNGKKYALKKILSSLDTLEVKEANLEKEIDKIWNPRFNLGWDEKSLLSMNHKGFTTIAKHFFELGLKAQSKDMIEALRTEYEKGRADVIADTLSWLENCWPKYCSNQTIIEGFKEAIKY